MGWPIRSAETGKKTQRAQKNAKAQKEINRQYVDEISFADFRALLRLQFGLRLTQP